MQLKWFGAIMVLICCSGIGIYMAFQYKMEIRYLNSLTKAVRFMIAELQYRSPPLPELCRKTARECSGPVKGLFIKLSDELDRQIAPDVSSCLRSVLQNSSIAENIKPLILELGATLGKFDLNGQVNALLTFCDRCGSMLTELEQNKGQRVRNYQTLGICCGAALVIILV